MRRKIMLSLRVLRLPILAVAVVASQGACDRTGARGRPNTSTVAALEAQPRNAPLPAVLVTGARPPYRAGTAKAWEGAKLETDGGWSIHPGGSVQNRVPLAAWASPAVGPALSVALVHDAAAAATSHACGNGFRLAVGALLAKTDTGVDIEEPDGTRRTFTTGGPPNSASEGQSFVPEVFDTDALAQYGSSYVLRASGGLRRIFKRRGSGLWREEERIDRVGDVVTIEYDEEDYPSAIRDSAGRRATFARSLGGRYTSITDPEGRVFTLAYTGSDLTEIQAPAVDDGTPRLKFAYDASHRIVSRSGWGGANDTAFTYDDSGRATRVFLPERYQSYGLAWTDTSLTITDALGSSASYVYANGALVQSTDARGLSTTITRDSLLRPTAITDSRGHSTLLGYNAANDVTDITDPLGRLVTTAYDRRHNPISIIDTLGGTKSYTYDAFDGPTSFTNALGETRKWDRDAFGNLVRVADFPLDGRGAVVRMKATYDALGRVLTVTSATGLTKTISYDAYGAVASIQDPGRRATQSKTTPMGDPVEVTNQLGEVASFTYDPLGRLTRATNPQGAMTFTHDLDGRMTGLVDTTAPNAMRLTTSYTPDGRVATRTIGATVIQAGPSQIAGVP